jgi:transaldolase
MSIKEIGFSLWLDFIERDYLDDGFKKLIADGVINGATSNPSIFKNAILSSPAYKSQIESLKGRSPKDIYEEIAIFDIKKAATLLEPLYKSGNDGYVSIEVDPRLCFDAQGTIDEGVRLYNTIAKKNVMIKVPATKEGYEAIEQLVSKSIPVNVTLIFSKNEAILALEAIERGNKKANKVPSCVLSVFVSRVDRTLDKKLEALNIETAKAGILNAASIYNAIENIGVSNIRTLFASTGVKGDTPKQSYYIEELLAKNSVNTAPLETIEAFLKDSSNIPKLPISQNEIDIFFDRLKQNNIDFDNILQKLKDDGIEAFSIAFDEILKELD